MSIGFKGTRWFKCDLHLHTPASQCFQEQSVTATQWVERAIEQGLDCVAVTDHNTGEWIDAIKKAAMETSLTIFPGVELTCDTSKIHLLILFNVDKTTEYVNDFIIKCGIDRDMFADKQAGSKLTIFKIAERANNEGAVVIPAHIDDYNGLESIGTENLKSLFELPYINSVQVVHKQFTDILLKTNNNEELRKYLNEYHNIPTPPIDFLKMADWHKPVKKAVEKKLAITNFSDNPHDPKNPKHGLHGIGSHCTWIKMDEKPSLEGLRQAFLLPDFRVKNEFVSTHNPYKTPDLWIKSISISNTTLTEGANILKIDLSPQLNTIIGGRGSGKSSILRFIRGVFNRTEDIRDLSDILKNHEEFYKLFDNRTKKGVLKDKSIIDVEFVRNNVLYKITASDITNSYKQTIKINKLDAATQTWVEVSSEGYLNFFEFEQYSQKQIYEVAQEPNSLKDRIDKSIPEIEVKKNEMEVTRKSFLEKSAVIRTVQQKITGKGRLQTEISDIEDRINIFQQSGIALLLSTKERFLKQENVVNEFIEQVITKENSLSKLINELDLSEFDYSNFDVEHTEGLKVKSDLVFAGYDKIKLNYKN
jgi:PHP family Zn ribbon phosphoesterase